MRALSASLRATPTPKTTNAIGLNNTFCNAPRTNSSGTSERLSESGGYNAVKMGKPRPMSSLSVHSKEIMPPIIRARPSPSLFLVSSRPIARQRTKSTAFPMRQLTMTAGWIVEKSSVAVERKSNAGRPIAPMYDPIPYSPTLVILPLFFATYPATCAHTTVKTVCSNALTASLSGMKTLIAALLKARARGAPPSDFCLAESTATASPRSTVRGG